MSDGDYKRRIDEAAYRAFEAGKSSLMAMVAEQLAIECEAAAQRLLAAATDGSQVILTPQGVEDLVLKIEALAPGGWSLEQIDRICGERRALRALFSPRIDDAAVEPSTASVSR